MQGKIVVAGNGMVGQRFLEALAEGSSALDVTVFAEESRPAYDRVQLSSVFSGKTAGDLTLAPADFFESRGITLHLSERVTGIDRESKFVRTALGREVTYDTLVLATGSYPFIPPVPGRHRPACFVYRTLEDLEGIRAAARDARSGAVVGGGLLGLEAAKALRDLGLETHVVEFAPRLMALQVDEMGGALLRRKIEALGVHVLTGKSTREISAGARARHRMDFTDGSELEVDLIVFSAGIRPCDALGRSAGLAVGERGGIVIDDTCRTSDPSIYAIGECALWNGQIFGLVAPGYQMAEVAAAHIAGDRGALHGRRSQHEAQAARRGRGIDRRCACGVSRRAVLHVRGRAPAALQEARRGRVRTAPPRRRPGRGRGELRRMAADDAQPPAAARAPGGADPAGGGRRAGRRGGGSIGSCGARALRPDLLLQ